MPTKTWRFPRWRNCIRSKEELSWVGVTTINYTTNNEIVEFLPALNMISSARTVKMMSLTFEGSNIVVVIATVFVNTVSVLFTKVFFFT